MPVLTRAQQLAKLGLSFDLPGAPALSVDVNPREKFLLLLYAIQAMSDDISAAVGGAPAVPTTTNFAINSTAGGVTLRNSETPKIVSVVNQGANPITVTVGETAPVAGTTGITLATGDVYESPRPIIGKVRAICAAGQTATATLILY